MTKVDFYVLTDNSPATRFACRLLEKAYQEKQKVYVHMNDQADAHALDEQLWTYRDNSFIPHNLYEEQISPPPPIQIGYSDNPQCRHAILLNLSDQVPDFYQKFSRIIEIVGGNNKDSAREHFRYYREQQFDINSYNI